MDPGLEAPLKKGVSRKEDGAPGHHQPESIVWDNRINMKCDLGETETPATPRLSPVVAAARRHGSSY
jgi:hypothetical protein